MLADFRGITVKNDTALRREFRLNGCKYQVVKNTLLGRAVEGTGMAGLEKLFVGPTAIAYSFEDPAAPAQIATKVAKGEEKFVIKGGFVDGKALDAKGVEALSKLPAKDELRATFLATLVAVPQNFARLSCGRPAEPRSAGGARAAAGRRRPKQVGPPSSNDRSILSFNQRGNERNQGAIDMADVTKEQVVDFLSKMSVMDMATLKKELEEKWGVKAAVAAAAGPAAAAGGGCGPGGRADRVHRHPDRRWRQQDRRHQGGPRSHEPRPQGSEGPRRRRAEDRQGRRQQGRRRDDQEEAGRGGRQGRRQVVVCES